MRFELIRLDGFGRLQDATFHVSQGLNVFFGANEAGKSTLQQAIWALLYGFYRTDRRLQADSERLERLRPWQGGAYGGYLVYRLDNNRAYRISRKFDDADLSTSILEADTGRDVTNDYERGRLGRVAFAREHLGMSEDVFVNTCFVRQADLHRLADAAQAITETVVNLAGTGSQDRSVSQALEALESALREQVGTARARTKPLPQAQDRLDGLRREREGIIERRRNLDAEYDKHTRLVADRGQVEHDLIRLRYLLTMRRKELLDSKVAGGEKLLARIAALESELAGVNDADDWLSTQRDAVARLHQVWLSANSNLERAQPDYDASQAGASKLREDRQALLDQQRPLEAARSIALDHESTVRKLHQTWREALQSARQASDVARQARVELDEMVSLRARNQSLTPVLAIPPSILADLNSRWAKAEAELGTAESVLHTARRAQQSQATPQMAMEASHTGAQPLNPTTLATLKQREAKVRQLQAQAQEPWLVAAPWGIGAGGLMALLAAVITVAGAVGRVPMATVVGVALLLFGFVVLVMGVGGLLWRRNRQAAWKVASDGLAEACKAWGVGDVAALESSFAASLALQTPQAPQPQVEADAVAERVALQVIEGEARAALGIAASASFGRADLVSTINAVEDAQRQSARLKALEDQWNTLDQIAQLRGTELDNAAAALREVLQQNQFAGEDLDREVDQFQQLCEKRRLLERLEAQLLALDAKLDSQAVVERSYANLVTEVGLARDNLARALQRYGIEADDPARGFKEFENRRDRAELAEEKRKLAKTLDREVQVLLAGQTLDELKQQQTIYARDVQTLLAANQSLAGLRTVESPEILQQQLDDLSERKVAIGQELAAVEERLRSAETAQRNLAEVDEEMAETQETIAGLTFHKLALEAAIEHLQAAADEHHRNFLPRLNETVGQSLGRLTAGRYSSVLIDHHDLQIRVQVPGLPDPVTPDVLSRGAQEQIYLLLRLGLTELMSNGRERLPLVLDDPLVNYDSERLRRGLDFLADLADQTQVLLFTKDESTVAWFRAQHDASQGHAVHML